MVDSSQGHNNQAQVLESTRRTSTGTEHRETVLVLLFADAWFFTLPPPRVPAVVVQ
jgi:hypothetical protein